MTAASTVQIIVDFQDFDGNVDQQEKLTQMLYHQLRSLEAIAVERVTDPHPPKGSRGLGSFLWGLLRAEVNPETIKTLFDFLGDRLGDQPIKITAKFADGREFAIEASSRAELQAAEDTIRRLATL